MIKLDDISETVNDWIVVKNLRVTESDGGILMPETIETRMITAEIMKAPLKDKDGNKFPVKGGQRIFYDGGYSNGIEIECNIENEKVKLNLIKKEQIAFIYA